MTGFESKDRRRPPLSWALNAGLGALILVALLNPNGYFRGSLKMRAEDLALKAAIIDHWDSLSVGPRLDGGTGEVLLVEFGDYECPHCRSAFESLQELLPRFPEVGVAYHHFPQTPDTVQSMVQKAASCAGLHGNFLKFHARILGADVLPSLLELERLWRIATGSDIDQFVECLDSAASQEILERDILLGRALGVAGTPTFVWKGGILEGASGLADLLESLASM